MGKKTLKFSDGKNTADIDIELKKGRLSISGAVYEGKRLLRSERNLISCGQCLDSCRDFIPAKLAEVWERWHLNDLRAGTPKQEKAIREWRPANNGKYDYTEACAYLASINLNPDLENNRYQYGSAWLTEELPNDVIEYLASLGVSDSDS